MDEGHSLAGISWLNPSAPYGTIKTLRSDGGGEFIGREFQNILIENKINHQTSAPYSPHQNGTAERAWRSLYGTARCLLISSGLSKTLWTYAVRHGAYIRNRCYTCVHKGGASFKQQENP